MRSTIRDRSRQQRRPAWSTGCSRHARKAADPPVSPWSRPARWGRSDRRWRHFRAFGHAIDGQAADAFVSEQAAGGVEDCGDPGLPLARGLRVDEVGLHGGSPGVSGIGRQLTRPGAQCRAAVARRPPAGVFRRRFQGEQAAAGVAVRIQAGLLAQGGIGGSRRRRRCRWVEGGGGDLCGDLRLHQVVDETVRLAWMLGAGRDHQVVDEQHRAFLRYLETYRLARLGRAQASPTQAMARQRRPPSRSAM